MKKPIYSKTLWFNLVMALFAIAWPSAQDYIAAHPAMVGVFWSGINMLLRLITKDKIVLVE